MNYRNFKMKGVILPVVQPSTYSTLGVHESPPLASVVRYLVPIALLAVLSPVNPHSVKGFLPHTPQVPASFLPKYRTYHCPVQFCMGQVSLAWWKVLSLKYSMIPPSQLQLYR